MAIIYRCDGCDKEFKEMRNNLVTVSVEYNTHDMTSSRDESKYYSRSHHFCLSCVGTFNRGLDNLLTTRVEAA